MRAASALKHAQRVTLCAMPPRRQISWPYLGCLIEIMAVDATPPVRVKWSEAVIVAALWRCGQL